MCKLLHSIGTAAMRSPFLHESGADVHMKQKALYHERTTHKNGSEELVQSIVEAERERLIRTSFR